jgi:glycosyltransferase involved in cell wall biosynthesis
MLSVLLVCPRLEARGSSSYAMRLMRRLGERGIDLQVVSPDPMPAPMAGRADLRWTRVPRLMNPVLGPLFVRLLVGELRANPPDLIHATSRATLPQATAIGRALGVPVVVTAHDHLRPGETFRRDRFRVDPRVVQRVVAVSESIKTDLLRNTRLPEAFVEVIVGGVETEHTLQPVVPFAAGHVPVIGTAGPLEAVKGIPYFLGAAKRVLEAGREIEFLVAGSGPEEANLRRMTRDLGIAGRVTFVPYVLEFSETLAAMDLFVLPSLQQGLGTVMLEAMSLARPVVATGVGGVYSVVRDGETGLVVPPSQSEPLSEKMLLLADQPELARRLGETAREVVRKQFGVDRMIEETVALYREVGETVVAGRA